MINRVRSVWPVTGSALKQKLLKNKYMETIRRIEDLNIGEKLTFPIAVTRTVRNTVSVLNTIHYLEGKKWRSHTFKEEGIITAERLS